MVQVKKNRFGELVDIIPEPCEEDKEWWNIITKSAALKVSTSVITVISHLPDDMIRKRRCLGTNTPIHDSWRTVSGSGFIVESKKAVDVEATSSYISIALTNATLFNRSDDIQPTEVEFEVYLSDGTLCKSNVLACDFHYNLAAVRIISDTFLQPVKLQSLDDVVSIDPAEQFCLRAEKSFQLRPHSSLLKILPGEKVIAVGRYAGRFSLAAARGDFSMKSPSLETPPSPPLDCKELCYVDKIEDNEAYKGGPVINFSGEVIGIMFYGSAFLPTNIVSRWWEHYTKHRVLCRPWIEIRVSNLHAAGVAFQEEFIHNFPNNSTGVVVNVVEPDSPAYRSGIRPLDVITQCDGVPVRSTLEFFETIWDKVGQSVELEVLRVEGGVRLKLTATIGEATPDKFYRWRLWKPPRRVCG